MKSWKTKSGYEIFKVLSGRSNSYLIVAKEYNILVDTGMSSAYRNLTNNINLLKLTNKKVDYLILTHTHFDHCQNAARIKKHYGCKIIVSKEEKQYAETGYTPVPLGTIALTKYITRIGAKLDIKRLEHETFTPDILVDEYFDFQESDLDIKIIKSDGHSSGSISVLLENEIGIVGDAMFGIFKNSVFPPFADNEPDMIISWNKLLSTGCDIFLPGHGKEIKRDLLQKEYYKYARKRNIGLDNTE